MRIVTWNCFSGECRNRAARLAHLRPDVAVLQECANPSPAHDDQCVWFGSNPQKGVGVVAAGAWRLDQGPAAPGVPDSVFPVRVSGPTDFNLLAVWAQERPTYVRAIMEALDDYRAFLKAGPAVVAGDFNSHGRWDGQDPQANHSGLVRRLREEFGLVSAFHAAGPRLGVGDEPATLYWQWQEQKPFHIDYCFIPEAWAEQVRRVEVGNYGEWAQESDHRPLMVEVDLAAMR